MLCCAEWRSSFLFSPFCARCMLLPVLRVREWGRECKREMTCEGTGGGGVWG